MIKPLQNISLMLFTLFGIVLIQQKSYAQATNIALLATFSAAPACNTGPCSSFNDLNFGTCGTQQVWITSGATNPGSSVNVTATWSSPQIVKGLTIHAGQAGSRYLGGGTIEV
jgi:hypothetical protein